MTKVFLYLANRSIRVGFLILAVIGLRFLFRKLPKGPQLLLWAVVALRLAVPFSPESPWSLLPSAEPLSSQATINTPLQRDPSILQAENEISVPAATEAPHVVTGAAPTTATQPQTGSSASPGALETPAASGLGDLDVFFRICTVVWLLGMAAMISYGLVSYLRLRKKLSVSLRQDGCIYICDEISSPFVLGLCRPRIYLPSSLSQAAKPYVLAHEQAHLRHGDAWWKLLGFLLLSVYWFHPLVWAAYALFCRDLEMACDERAVKGMDDRQRKDYACTLLLCAAPKGSFSVCPVAFSQNSIKARIKNLLQKKNARLWAGLLALIAALVVILCFATNPKSSERTLPDDNGSIPETEAVSMTPEDQAAADFMQKYLDTCQHGSFEEYAKLVYFPNTAVYVQQQELYYPSIHDPAAIDSRRRINDKLWAFAILYDGIAAPNYLFVGELDGALKVIQAVEDIPESLRENLRKTDFHSDTFMHESSEFLQSLYDLRFFAVPKQVECFQPDRIQASGMQVSFQNFLNSTDAWRISKDSGDIPGPEEIDTGCRITGYDGRILVIRSGQEGIDLYNADGSWNERILGFSGDEILGCIKEWALNWDGSNEEFLNASNAIVLDMDSSQILYSWGRNDSAYNAGDWCRLALAIAAVQAVPDPENTVIDVHAPRTGRYTGFRDEVLHGLTVQDHLYRMLLFNQQDSAYALACGIFGSTTAAVEKMNEAAESICGNDPYFRDISGQNFGSLSVTDLAKLINAMLAEPLLNKIWCASSYTVPATQELVYSTNALLVGNPTGYHGIAQDDRVTGGLTSVSGDYADMAVTAEYQGKRVLCILTGALRITHPYGDDPNSYSVVDYWGNYEETEKLLNIAFG